MHRILGLSLSVLCLLTGCQGNGSPPAEPTAIASPIIPSATSAHTPVPTAGPTPTWTNTPFPLPPTPDPRRFVVAVPKAGVWDDPRNENKFLSLQTELILGEKVLVTGRRGEWTLIAAVDQPSQKDPLGYPGWVRSEALSPGWPAARKYAVVMTARAQLRVQPAGSRWMSVYLDTRLPVEAEQGDWVRVRLPDGRTGLLPLRDVRLAEDPSAPVATDSLFALAETLVGVPYRWGGTTPDSLDCSGFLYRVFHAYGITLSRDADDQATGGTAIARSDLVKGDLVFASETGGGAVTHVAMYWGNDRILDASGGKGVAIRPLAEELLYKFWAGARRYLP
jgi:cell wall-associated NlpC family hydrolase